MKIEINYVLAPMITTSWIFRKLFKGKAIEAEDCKFTFYAKNLGEEIFESRKLETVIYIPDSGKQMEAAHWSFEIPRLEIGGKSRFLYTGTIKMRDKGTCDMHFKMESIQGQEIKAMMPDGKIDRITNGSPFFSGQSPTDWTMRNFAVIGHIDYYILLLTLISTISVLFNISSIISGLLFTMMPIQALPITNKYFYFGLLSLVYGVGAMYIFVDSETREKLKWYVWIHQIFFNAIGAFIGWYVILNLPPIIKFEIKDYIGMIIGFLGITGYLPYAALMGKTPIIKI